MHGGMFIAAALLLGVAPAGEAPPSPEEPVVFVLDAYGLVARGRTDGRPLQPLGERWLREPIARDLEVVAGGLYLLSGNGEIYRSGYARPLASVPFGIDLARDLEYLPATDTFYLLDAYGGVYALGHAAEPVPRFSTFLGWDVARALCRWSGGEGLLSMDAFGRIQSLDRPGLQWDLGLVEPLAMDLESDLSGSPTVLLADGRVVRLLQAGGPAPEHDTPFFGIPIARDLEWHPSGRGGYVLDRFGGIHGFGDVPPIAPFASAAAVAVDLELVPPAEVAPPPHAAAGPAAGIHVASDAFPYWQEQVVVDVWVENADDLAGFSAELSYDPEVMTPVRESVQAGAFLTALGRSAQVLPPVVTEPGRLQVRGSTGAAGPGSGASGNGTLFTVRFRPRPLRIAEARENRATVLALESLVYSDPTQLQPVTVPPERCGAASITLLYLPPRVGLSLSDAPRPIRERVPLRLGQTVAVNLVASDLALARGCAFDLVWTRPNLEEKRFVEGPLLQSAGPTATLAITTARANARGARREHAISLLGRRDGVRGHGVMARIELVARRTGPAELRLSNVRLASPDGAPMPVAPAPDRILFEVSAP